MNQGEAANRVAALPFLSETPEQMRLNIAGAFASISTLVDLPPGAALLREGEVGGDLGYILLDGRVEVLVGDSRQAVLEAPALLGEMYQFNPHAQRTATVRTDGPARVFRFSWAALYAEARTRLSPEEQHALITAMERCILERFDRTLLLDIPVFSGVSDAVRLRICLLLQWLTRPLMLRRQETVFKQGDMCGGAGYLLLQGAVELRRDERPIEMRHGPDLIGTTPEFDPDQRWTATAVARGSCTLLRFYWPELRALAEKHLGTEGWQRFAGTVAKNAAEHFTY